MVPAVGKISRVIGVNGRLAAIIGVILGVAGCGSSATPTSPVAPTSPVTQTGSLVADWSGTISDAISGDGTIQLALSEEASNSPNSLAGTWEATFKNGDRFSGLSVGGL